MRRSYSLSAMGASCVFTGDAHPPGGGPSDYPPESSDPPLPPFVWARLHFPPKLVGNAPSPKLVGHESVPKCLRTEAMPINNSCKCSKFGINGLRLHVTNFRMACTVLITRGSTRIVALAAL